ncbi:MAG: VWA domain-containing protein [Lachnospiraceae bacterium]|nr:VWA domain-containing protein [Lachnospiraceae bacterium]
MTTEAQNRITEDFEDMCLSFFMELRDRYHYRLSADQLLGFLNVLEDIDIADKDALCMNMQMFFCHRQYEADHFPEIFDRFFLSEKQSSARLIRRLEKEKDGHAGENRSVFISKNIKTALKDQKVHFSLPNFKAERFFAQFELLEGICDYSPFIHAGFLNLYDDYISYYETLDDEDRITLIDTLIGEINRFISYCKKTLDDPSDFNRKSLEISATFKMSGNRERGENGEEEGEEEDEEELKRRLDEEKLRYQMLEDNRVPMAEDFTTKDIRLLTKHDMDQIERYIRENSYKFKARVNRNLKKPGLSQFDYKATVKQAFKTGMVPVELIYKNPKPRKVRIVCLLDISPSTIAASTILIHFLHSLGEVFHGGVEIYYFTDKTTKVTGEVRNRTVKDCINRIVSDSKNSVSDYSSAFESFNSEYFGDLSKDTVFLILGDMKNNYKRYRREPLRRIHDKVAAGRGKTILLNTDKKSHWYKDDSILRSAEASLDEVYEVRTVADIFNFLCELKV